MARTISEKGLGISKTLPSWFWCCEKNDYVLFYNKYLVEVTEKALLVVLALSFAVFSTFGRMIGRAINESSCTSMYTCGSVFLIPSYPSLLEPSP